MIERLAESKKAEQVFVRYAFRFWMGRNETLNDAHVLQDAYHAYRNNGGLPLSKGRTGCQIAAVCYYSRASHSPLT